MHPFKQFYQFTSDAGGCIISVRDYDAMERGGRKLYPRLVHKAPRRKVLIFDCWEFDGDYYEIMMYIVEDGIKPPVGDQLTVRGHGGHSAA